jgi:hypothetical protein
MSYRDDENLTRLWLVDNAVRKPAMNSKPVFVVTGWE